MGLGGFLELRRIAHDIGRGQSLRQFLVTGFDLVKAFKHIGQRPLISGQYCKSYLIVRVERSENVRGDAARQ